MRLVMLFLAFIQLSATPPSRVNKPSPPNFKQRIDYVQWYKDQLRFAEKDNAYEKYSRFMDQGKQPKIPEGAKAQLDQLRKSPRPWRSSEFPALANWLLEMEPLLAAYVEGSHRQHFGRPMNATNPKTLTEILLPGVPPSRLLSKALIVQVWQADETIDGDRFVTNLTAVIRHANHVSQGLTLMEQLVSIGIKDMVYRHIAQAIAADILATTHLRALLSLLQENDATGYNHFLIRSLHHEAAIFYEMVQLMCSEGGRLGTAFSKSEMPKYLRLSGKRFTPDHVAAMMLEKPTDLCKKAGDYFTSIIRLCEEEFPVSLAGEIRTRRRPLIESSAFLTIFFPDLERAFELGMRGETNRRGIQVLLALAINKKQHGTWPEALNATKLEKSVLTDPLSGKTFVYRVNGAEMKLYSIGEDGVDNGATQRQTRYRGKKGEDLVIWPIVQGH